MKAFLLACHNIGGMQVRALLARRFDIQAVFTHEVNPNENIRFEPVAELAAAKDIPVYAPADIKDS